LHNQFTEVEEQDSFHLQIPKLATSFKFA